MTLIKPRDWLSDNMLKFDAQIGQDGIHTVQSMMGEVTRGFIELRMRVEEEAVRKWLIANGWTPPPESRP